MRMPTRVLIVDDDRSFRQIAAELLHARGFEVVAEAANAREAADAVRNRRPDAVLLDVHLADADGFSVLATLCQARAELHVLLTSSDATAATSSLAEQCGATGFVPKTALMTADLMHYLNADGETTGRAETSEPQARGGGLPLLGGG
jgi:two-component system, chemotaxis family, protein-glutamate methylesterase/glutaminase